MSQKVFALALVMLCIFSACGNGNSKKSKEIMFSAEEINWGIVNNKEDYWVSNTWEVLYDGTVKHSEKYHLTGVKNKKNWKMDQDQLNLLQSILKKDFQEQEDRSDNAADGVGWDMVYYNEEHEEIHHFNGYIYGVEPLEKIASILDNMQ